jgi:diguanylate cyclase (GGDEF)-like protein
MNEPRPRSEGNAPDLPRDPSEVEQRKALLDFGARDIGLLRELHALLAGQAAFFVDDFYAHLLAFEETRQLIPDEATLSKLKKTQLSYFNRLTAGEYDADYLQDRLRIGVAHQRVGLAPRWYLGAYSKYLALLLPKIGEFHRGDEEKILATTSALLKVVFLDMGVAIDTYIDADQQAIRHKAAQLAALNQAAVAISSSLGLQELRDKILAWGTSLTGCQATAIVFHDEGSRGFDQAHTRGLSEHFVKSMRFRDDGLAAQAFRSHSPILSSDLSDSRHKLSGLAREEGIRSFICLPLASHARPLGVLYFYRKDNDSFLAEEIDLLTTFSYLAAGALENAQLHAKAVTLAATDTLTGLANRRTFDAHLKSEFHCAQRFSEPFALLLLDIDHFKRVNDTYGHQAGDEVLKSLARIFKKQLREVDIAARYGGEEFVAILPESDEAKAHAVAERIRQAVAERPFMLHGGNALPITISIGVACYPDCADSTEQIVEHADQAMYLAKQTGRNRVCLFREMLPLDAEECADRIVALLREGPQAANRVAALVAARISHFRDHVDKVENLAARLARKIGLSKKDRETLSLAATLHDIGQVAIPASVVNKREEFTPEEWEQVRLHPVTGANLIEQAPALSHILPIVRHHHEHFDGGGYTDGLRGEQIPYLARLLGVVDVYASLTSDRPYRRALKPHEARALIAAGSGKQFDPELAAQFVAMLAEERQSTDA